jgi:uncharacterized surface protein with fasciclin (FAS1) repeats
MKKLLLLLLIPTFIFAQTSHEVEVGGFYYSPQELNINVGDTVNWTNVGGNHNVNFDVNSLTGISFGNPIYLVDQSLPVSGVGFMGSIVFNEAGTFNYDCSVGYHAANGQTGTVIVLEPSNTVVDIVVGSETHTTLETAVTAAGLVETLSGEGPFTIFAPTDAAFAALPEGTLDTLLSNPTGDLTNILLNHVYSGQAMSTDLSDGMVVSTLYGDSLMVTIDSTGVYFNDAMVTVADLSADNGVVHVIDAILLPSPPPPSNTVYDVVSNSDIHSTLSQAISIAGFVDFLSSDQYTFTLFAPTDAAFSVFNESDLATILNDLEYLQSVLKYHLVDGVLYSSDLSDQMVISSYQGNLEVTFVDDMVYINEALVTVVDIVADNGIVHVIDAVLIPEEAPLTVADIISYSENHSTLKTALNASGLNETLSGEGPYTVFAPTDDAFAQLPDGTLDLLLSDPTGQLTNILLNHVHSGNVLSTDLSDQMMIPTMYNDQLTVNIDDVMMTVMVGDALVTEADLLASNGVVHVVNSVLLPPDLDIKESNFINKDIYLYSINILGEKIDRNLSNQIVFDVYSSGRVIKRFKN